MQLPLALANVFHYVHLFLLKIKPKTVVNMNSRLMTSARNMVVNLL
jgi:hypothetical protein